MQTKRSCKTFNSRDFFSLHFIKKSKHICFLMASIIYGLSDLKKNESAKMIFF